MKTSIRKVLVLVATYNGEKYLEDQIRSIINQEKVTVDILVADDCSSDGTIDILKKYKAKYKNFNYYVNITNKGFSKNFIDLFYSSPINYDYYAFSDQDDVWLPRKLINAINSIESHRDSLNGCLYCSNLLVVDKNLNYIGKQGTTIDTNKSNKAPFLLGNIATGSTIVFDKLFSNFIRQYKPSNVKLHDYWFFIVAVFCASYFYDDNAYINYRQHELNQIGSNKKKITLKKIKDAMAHKFPQDLFLMKLIQGFNNFISENDKKDIYTVINYNKSFKSRFKLMFSKKFGKRWHLLFYLKLILRKL